MLPAMKVNEKLLNNYITATEVFKTSSSLYWGFISKIEELGIGRPSTYAPTISTIIRNYVEEILMVEIILNYVTGKQSRREVIKRKYGVW
jgi:DNA topoisomerase IA